MYMKLPKEFKVSQDIVGVGEVLDITRDDVECTHYVNYMRTIQI